MIFESTDFYAERWAKRRKDNPRYLSKWKAKPKELVTNRISASKEEFKRPNQKILNDLGVKDCHCKLREDFVLVFTDKAACDMTVICKTCDIETLIKEPEINTLFLLLVQANEQQKSRRHTC